MPELATRQAARVHGDEKWQEEWVKKLDFTLLAMLKHECKNAI